MSHFGEALRTQMERKKLTGQQLAERIELSPTSVSKTIQGHSRPRQTTLNRILLALCDSSDEERFLLNAYSGTSPDLTEEAVAETPGNYNAERERIERYMEIRTQSMSFKNAVARSLENSHIEFQRDFCTGNFSIDFLVTVEEKRIGIECKFNTNRDFEKSISLAAMFRSKVKCDEGVVAIPYIDHVVENALRECPASVKILTIQELQSHLLELHSEKLPA